MTTRHEPTAAVPLRAPRALPFEAAGRTDVGAVRERNEDHYACWPELGLFVVADGLGGRPGGDVASRTAVRVVLESLAATATIVDADVELRRERLVASFERANARVFAVGRATGTGMGTTLTAVFARAQHAVVAHVGDSRLYRFRGHQLEQLTDDHTVGAEMARAGQPCDEPAAIAQSLTRAIGCEPGVDIDARVVPTRPGDVLLLCSDGLWGVVPHSEIEVILDCWPSPREAAARLVQRANELGGPDNVTAVLVRWPGD